MKILRRVLIVLFCIIFFLVIFVWNILSDGWVEQVATHLIPKRISEKATGWGYDNNSISTSNFYTIAITGLLVAWTLFLGFILWDFKDRQRRKLLIYFPFLVVILGISTYNYAHGDYLVKPGYQAPLNLVLIFLSLVFILWIHRTKTKSTDGIIIKYIFLVVLGVIGFLVPSFFSLFYILEKLGVTEISPDLTIVTTICTLITTYIGYKEFKKEK
jgi:4-amino-4-deoxy-L-arabinose transferase-like glycosyltransferase